MAEFRRRYALLTPREREVLPFVVAGLVNKQTAVELGNNEITIQVHRGQITRKMAASSLADLSQMVEEKTFRADLYYRLSVFPIRLPSLRERKDDCVQRYSRQMGQSIIEIPDRGWKS